MNVHGTQGSKQRSPIKVPRMRMLAVAIEFAVCSTTRTCAGCNVTTTELFADPTDQKSMSKPAAETCWRGSLQATPPELFSQPSKSVVSKPVVLRRLWQLVRKTSCLLLLVKCYEYRQKEKYSLGVESYCHFHCLIINGEMYSKY